MMKYNYNVSESLSITEMINWIMIIKAYPIALGGEIRNSKKGLSIPENSPPWNSLETACIFRRVRSTI